MRYIARKNSTKIILLFEIFPISFCRNEKYLYICTVDIARRLSASNDDCPIV